MAVFTKLSKEDIKLFKDIKKLNALYIQENGGLGKIYDIYFLIFFLVFKKSHTSLNSSKKASILKKFFLN